MEIKWFGNTTFLIKNSTGKRILINPINLNSYITKYDFKFDLITLSNSQYGFECDKAVKSGSKVLNTCTEYTTDYVSIKGYDSYSDNIKGLKRGNNIIYTFEIDNIKFCHLGTLGHKLDSEILSQLKDLDFLFVPIGGHFSLDGSDAADLCNTINPKYIIPMFYKTSLDHCCLDGPYKFISHRKNIKKLKDTIKTSELSFSNNNSVIMLTP